MRTNMTLKTKAISFLIALVMLLSMLPMTAFAAGETEIYVGGIGMADGTYLANGATATTTTQPATGGYAYYNDGVLTLNNYEYEGEGYWYATDYSSGIYSPVKLEIVLVGQNSITNTVDYCDGITVEDDLTVSGDGALSLYADYGIYSRDITINGGSLDLIVYDEGFYVYDGDFTINGGVLNVIANDGIEVSGSVYFNGGVSTIDAIHGIMTVYSDSGIYLKDGMEILQPEDAVIADDYGYYFADAYGETGIRVTIGPVGTALPEIYVGGEGMADGTYLANGATATTTTAPESGGYAYYNDGVLTLNNYEYEGEGYWYATHYSSVIYSPVKLEIVLVGQSSITNTEKECDGITVDDDLTVSGDGRLDINATFGIYAWDSNVTIESGRLGITGEYSGVYADNDITINGGILNIVAESGIDSDYGSVSFNGGTTTIDSRVEYGIAIEAFDGININDENGVEILEPEGAEIYTYDDGGTDSSVIRDSDGNWNILAVIGVSGSAITVEATCDPYWGSVTGGDTYEKGSTATVTATPDENTKFEYWLDTSVELGDEPTEEELRAAIVSFDATYKFTVTENVSLEAVFSVPTEIGITPMLITGTDESDLLEAEWMDVEYDFGSVIPGAEPIALPGEVIDEIVTIGDKQYRFAGLISFGYDEATDTETAALNQTATIGAMPLYGSAEYYEWFTPISDGVYAAYMEYTPSDPPSMGYNSNIPLWAALLFISGGIILGLILAERKKRAEN